jgi:hypothetical protein
VPADFVCGFEGEWIIPDVYFPGFLIQDRILGFQGCEGTKCLKLYIGILDIGLYVAARVWIAVHGIGRESFGKEDILDCK